jgi:pimeloyl-ACP methyl ester carboxylesterase
MILKPGLPAAPGGQREEMATYALIHGAYDVGWYWHLVERELRQRGHRTVAPDLPIEDDDATLIDHAQAVVDAIEEIHDGGELTIVARSWGGRRLWQGACAPDSSRTCGRPPITKRLPISPGTSISCQAGT